MRRNVRRLNREIGHHAASLSNPTAVIPLSVPTSYQPRKAYEKKSALQNAANAAAAAAASLDYMDGDGMIGAQGFEDGVGGADGTTAGGKPRKSALKAADGTKKKGVRKAVNLAGKFTIHFFVRVPAVRISFLTAQMVAINAIYLCSVY
jgi:hypothetical protein